MKKTLLTLFLAMAVAAALDAMKFPEIVGCIAGDDTIMALTINILFSRRKIRRPHSA